MTFLTKYGYLILRYPYRTYGSVSWWGCIRSVHGISADIVLDHVSSLYKLTGAKIETLSLCTMASSRIFSLSLLFIYCLSTFFILHLCQFFLSLFALFAMSWLFLCYLGTYQCCGAENISSGSAEPHCFGSGYIRILRYLENDLFWLYRIKIVTIYKNFCSNQCSGPMKFWCGSGSGSADPCL